MILRLRSLVLVAAGLVPAMAAGSAMAQAIARQITLVVPYSAGGGTDTVARLIGDQMSRSLGQPVLIENVVGAGGTRANERVARSEPDGTTVLINRKGQVQYTISKPISGPEGDRRREGQRAFLKSSAESFSLAAHIAYNHEQESAFRGIHRGY